MSDVPTSPRIDEISWGAVRVRNPDATHKDAKLYPGGSREWDWNETGTHHVPGIQPADVEELLEHGARIVVLSRGMNRRLRIQEDTLQRLEREGVETLVAPTEEAARLYNELQEDEMPVGGLFHSTC